MKRSAKTNVMTLTLLLVLIATLLVPVARADEPVGGLRVGVAKADITWHVGRAGLDGLHSRQWAKAIVVDGPERFAFVRADLLMITSDLYESVVQRVAQSSLGIPTERIMVAATHAHMGNHGTFPHVGHAAVTKTFDPQEKEYIATGIAKAIEMAAADLRPAELGVGAGAVGFPGYNRRHNRNYLTHPELSDPELGVLRFDDATTGKPLVIVMNHALHPVVLLNEREPKTTVATSDFVGFTENFLEQALATQGDGGPMALWLNGAGGDQNPIFVNGRYKDAEWTGRALADEALRVARELEPEPLLAASMADKLIPLPEPGSPDPNDGDGQRVPWTGASFGVPSSARLHAVSFSTASSNAVLLSWPGEPISAIGIELKRLLQERGLDHAFIVGLANDWGGYFLTRAEYNRRAEQLKRGNRATDHERSLAFYGPGSADYLSHHLLNLAEHLLEGATIEQLELPPNAVVDRELTSAIAAMGIAGGGHRETGAALGDGEPKALREPGDVTRSQVASFVWRGGSPDVDENWIPRVYVQRRALPEQANEQARGGNNWVTVATEGTGEILLRNKVFPVTADRTSDSRWAAAWQPLFDTRTGVYRFLVEGTRQVTAGVDEPYRLASESFDVYACDCLKEISLERVNQADGATRVSAFVDYEEVPTSPMNNSETWADEEAFRLLPKRVATGYAVVDVSLHGTVIDTMVLSFVSNVVLQVKTIRPNAASFGNSRPLDYAEPVEDGSFEGLWAGDPNVVFELVTVEDEFGNLLIGGDTDRSCC